MAKPPKRNNTQKAFKTAAENTLFPILSAAGYTVKDPNGWYGKGYHWVFKNSETGRSLSLSTGSYYNPKVHVGIDTHWGTHITRYFPLFWTDIFSTPLLEFIPSYPRWLEISLFILLYIPNLIWSIFILIGMALRYLIIGEPKPHPSMLDGSRQYKTMQRVTQWVERHL